MKLIKVNGLMINPDKIACIERKTGMRTNETFDLESFSGIHIQFVGGGHKWLDDPTAEQVEATWQTWYEDRPLDF